MLSSLRGAFAILLAAAVWPAVASAQCSTDDLDGDGVPDVCPAGSNYIEGTAGPDTLRGTNGADCIFGLGGDDNITARNGNDYVCAGDGADVVNGGGDDDMIFGEGGNDDLTGANGNDTLEGGAGDDTVDGSAGSDTVNGGDGNDVVDGGGGSDIVSGESGDDSVLGGGGNDSLSGGAGIDTLDGGGGTDTCVEEVPGTADRLTNCDVITYASIAEVDLIRSDRGAVVSWTTTTEVGAVAFRVWRAQLDGRLDWVGEVGASPEGGPHGATYFVPDVEAPSEGAVSYVIEERTVSGGSVQHGPFVRWAPQRGRTSIAPSTLLPRRVATPVSLRRLEKLIPLHGPSVFERKNLEPPSGAEIMVDQTGVIEVSAAAIAGALDLSVEETKTRIEAGGFLLELGGEPIAWHGLAGGTAIRFISNEVMTPFAARRRYLLTVGDGPRMDEQVVEPLAPVEPHTFVTTKRFEENVFPGPTGSPDPRRDLFFWHGLGAGDEATIQIDLPALSGASAEELRLTFHAVTDHPGQPHRVELLWNGESLGAFYTFGRMRHTLSASLSGVAALLQNELVVRHVAAGEVPPAIFVDAAEVDYPRTAEIDGPSFRFTAAAQGLSSVSGITSATLLLYDVTAPNAPSYHGELAIDESATLSFQAPDPSQHFLVAAPEAVGSPVGVAPHRPDDLRSTALAADYLIIAPSELLADAETLAAHRRADGYQVLVVDVDDVYWGFTHGEPDPLAVRELLSFAWQHWETAPRYVTLLGKGSLDYRDLQGLGGNWMPAPLAPTDGGLFPSDSMLGDVVGDDGVPEIAVGRLPVTSGAELEQIVASIAQFEGSHATSDAVFASDDSERDEFGAALGFLLGWTEPGRTVEIDLNTDSLEQARARLLSDWERSLGWVTYVGHGGLDRLADEGLLTSEDVPALTELGRAPMVVGWTCNIGRFDIPGFFALGEQLVTTGASAGVFSATGWSNHVDSDRLRTAFTEAAFASDAETIGEVMLIAHAAAVDAPLALHRVYGLLGDPALRLRQPKAVPEPGPVPNEPAPDPTGAPSVAPEERSGSTSGCEIASPTEGRGPFAAVLWLAVFAWLVRRRRSPQAPRRRLH